MSPIIAYARPTAPIEHAYSPESQGLVCASIYIVVLILFIPYAFSESITTHYDTERRSREGLVVDEFPHHQVSIGYVACMASIQLGGSS